MKSLNHEIRAVVLDLGNVVLDLSPQLTLKAMGKVASTSSNNSSDSTMRFSQWPVYMDYESGRTETDEFISQLQKTFNLSWPKEKIIEAWNLMLPGFLPQVESVLKECPLPLYALSNTNAIHLEHISSMPEAGIFKRIFTSFQMKHRKPSVEIFIKLIKELNLSPEEILFVDDLEENVLAARTLKIKAERCYRSALDLQNILQSYSCLGLV